MIDDPYCSIRGKYRGASIAVLGSGPSLPHLFERKEDVVIGVNGAGALLRLQDYFLSDDSAAPSKTWFQTLDKRITMFLTSGAAIRVPQFFPDQRMRNRLCDDYKNKLQSWLSFSEIVSDSLENFGRTDNLQYPRRSSDGRYYLLPTHPFLEEFERNLPIHESPHVILKYRSVNEELSREQIRLNVEGTSSHMALQVAYIMGAREIHLYGVEFSNTPESGRIHGSGNYFYKPELHETGMTLDSQLQTMDNTIRIIIERNVAVYSHILSEEHEKWNTKLVNSIKIAHE